MDAIEEIRVWMERNFVKLNSKKTEYMLISSPHMRNTITSIDVTVGRETVSPSDSARNLGVYFDKSMNMDRHISHICQTAYFQLRKVAAIRPFLTHAAAETLIHSLITSRLDYCNSLLAGLPSSSLNRLQAVQNAAARLLMKKKKVWSYHTHIDGTPLATSQEKDTIQGSPTDVQGLARPVTWLYIIPHWRTQTPSRLAHIGTESPCSKHTPEDVWWPCIFGRCSKTLELSSCHPSSVRWPWNI